MKTLLRRAVREIAIVLALAAAFSTVFIAGHLVMYQSWPRWK